MTASIERLFEIMRRLRAPAGGCPWDRAQTFETLVKHTLEEAHEVADAIERGALDELPGELGDLLFQIVFYCQIATEQGRFGFGDVAAALAAKLERRHPHVFGDEPAGDAAAQARRWERVKAAERRAGPSSGGELGDVPRALPALVRAGKLQARAARVGFDWTEPAPVFAKLDEEVAELRAAHEAGLGAAALEDELGDVLFSCVNLARHLGLDAEGAARAACRKFERRFRHLEEALAREGRAVADAGPEELDRLWGAAKAAAPGED